MYRHPLLIAVLLVLSACSSASAPRVTTFEAFPRTIGAPGERVTLSWTLEADPATFVTLSAEPSVALDPTEVSGQTRFVVTPDRTTTYTLVAQSVGGSARKSVTVELIAGELIASGRVSGPTRGETW